jgi:hypothetical protein
MTCNKCKKELENCKCPERRPNGDWIDLSEKRCQCKACNPKIKQVFVKIPKGYNWTKTTNDGEKLLITFIEII